MNWRAIAALSVLATPALYGTHVSAQEAEQSYVHIPETVSPEWQGFLRSLPDPNLSPQAPASDDMAGWQGMQDAVDRLVQQREDRVVRVREGHRRENDDDPRRGVRRRPQQRGGGSDADRGHHDVQCPRYGRRRCAAG